jgi:4a-hydroxytetrahydrobiopterin dehydratase
MSGQGTALASPGAGCCGRLLDTTAKRIYKGAMRTVTELLSDIAIQRELGTLNGWSRRGAAIVKTYQFPTFPDGIAFVGRVAKLAETAGHHPDMDIRYTKIVCSLSTHDRGGITQKDLDLARAMDSVVEA